MATSLIFSGRRRAVTVPRGSLVTTAGPPGRTGATAGGGGGGPPGAQGPRGTGWFTGSGAPPVTIAGEIVGDLYLNLVNGDVYQFS